MSKTRLTLLCPITSPQHTGQHCPLVVVGAVSVLVQNVGKHQTSEQKVLGLPPKSPVAPVMDSTLIAGFTQYGQQCPGYSVRVKPAGHLSSGHSTVAHGSTWETFLEVWMSIFVFISRSRPTTKLSLLKSGFRSLAASAAQKRATMKTRPAYIVPGKESLVTTRIK